MKKYLEDIICCPRCHSPLTGKVESQNELFCANSECEFASEGFLTTAGQPVLVDFGRSILSKSAFLDRGGQSYIPRNDNRASFKVRARNLLFGSNPLARASCTKVLNLLKKAGERPRILVIGGGTRGLGVDELYSDTSIDLVGIDVYASGNTQVVADGHQLPFVDGSFDGVWIQAVLEHVLDPPIVVAEIHRVLKPGGLVFAETPFMQQVHEGAYDFTRYTVSGHRWLFRNFTAIEAKGSQGAGTAFRWSAEYLARSLTGSRKFGLAVSVLFFWTRFLDSVGGRRHHADAACAVYFIGSKASAPIGAPEMVSFYSSQAKG